MRMNEQFQYMKLKMDTPMDSAPIANVPFSPAAWPAMIVEAKPMSGTVIFEMILGRAKRSISLFIFSLI